MIKWVLISLAGVYVVCIFASIIALLHDDEYLDKMPRREDKDE